MLKGINDIFGNVNGQYNIAYFCSKYQCDHGHGDRVAIEWIFPDLTKREISFNEIESGSNACANMLLDLGIKKGDRVFTFIHTSIFSLCLRFSSN